MIDRDTLRSCYRAVLGRSPESAAVEEDKIRWTPDLEALIRDLIGSPEFQAKLPASLTQAYAHPGQVIEVDGRPDRMQALFARLKAQWTAMGDTEPYWSVLTHDEFKIENLDPETKARFFESGALHADLMEIFALRTGTAIRNDVCLELGCGVGRVTRHLAQRFAKVIAVDISEGNLREARAMATQTGLSNVDFVLLRSPQDLEQLPSFDVLYSVMVLQHNPPPVQKYQLDVLLSKLRKKGVFFFQLQTFASDYTFRIDPYLATPIDTMDMHSLPMHEVLATIRKFDLPLKEVQPDYFTGRMGSFTFFGGGSRKRTLLKRLLG